MGLQATYEEISLKKPIAKLLNETFVQSNTNLPDTALDKILAVSATASLLNEEIALKKIKYSGRVIFTAVYIDENGAIKKAECGSEFQNVIDKEDLTDNAFIKIALLPTKTVAVSKNGNIYLTANVTAEVKIFAPETVKYANGGEEMFVKKEERRIVKSVCAKKSVYPVDEEFEIGYAVGEVLLHQTELFVNAVTCGVDSVIIDGEANLSLCLLQKIENSDILKENKVIPFRLEVEAPETMPSDYCIANANLKGVKIEVVVDEETGKSTVKVSLKVEMDYEVYEESKIQVVVDAYSQEREVILNKEEVSISCPSLRKTCEKKISARGVFQEPLPAGARLNCPALEKINVSNIRTVEEGVLIEGTAECVAFIKTNDGLTVAKTLEAPFTVIAEGSGEYTVELLTGSFFVKIVSLDSFDIDFTLKIALQEYEKENFSVISSVAEGEEKVLSQKAMSVYIPLKGEELWDVAKRLNSCPEVILEINGDLEFPLTGEERLIIFRQEKKNY